MPKYLVLIADDDDSQRNVQKLILDEVAKSLQSELRVDETADSVQTRKCLSQFSYDLIILDNEFKDDLIPGHLPGIALLQLMRKAGLNMNAPTVFCSGDPYNSLRPMVEKYGAIYYPKAKADAEEMTHLYVKLLQQ
jgi:CheY-like chemotaxis protein